MKKHMLVCFAAYFMAAHAPVNAQENNNALKEKYERETIMLDGNKNKYIKNKEKKRIGIFGKGLDKEFTDVSNETKEELAVCRKQRKRGTILLIAGGAVFVTAAVVAPFITFPVFLGTFGAGMLTYDIGAIDLYRSRDHLHKAVWMRNRDLLVKQ